MNNVVEIENPQRISVIELLEDLLAAAKDGGITEITAIFSNGNNFTIESSDSSDIRKLVGGIEIIKQHQIRRMLD